MDADLELGRQHAMCMLQARRKLWPWLPGHPALAQVHEVGRSLSGEVMHTNCSLRGQLLNGTDTARSSISIAACALPFV